ncbi:SAF domain-containing protein [Variovorax sp. OV700]|nr:SAF domain-containing protein [Variovorax sp. OV700]
MSQPRSHARVIRLHADDDVVISLDQLVAGTHIESENVAVAGLIPPGHKMATRAIEPGAAVRRYGQIIGFASRPIRAGQHVHTHNLAMGDFTRDHAHAIDARPTLHAAEPATFEGIVREDGRRIRWLEADRDEREIALRAWSGCNQVFRLLLLSWRPFAADRHHFASS